jgi:hypothetical protein
MKHLGFYLLPLLISIAALGQQKNAKRLLLAEQSQHRVVIVNVESGDIEWEWRADTPSIRPEHFKWFTNPSDAKIVDHNRCVLTCASGGGIALIRRADKKVLFYAYAGGNTHSIELLPDGNIVSASSHGNKLTVFRVDTLHFPKVNWTQVYVPFGHNVVWDKKRMVFWSAGLNTMRRYAYNFKKDGPGLALLDTFLYKPSHDQAHDLFPVWNKDALYLTDTKNVYIFDIEKNTVKPLRDTAIKNVKAISSGPGDYPTIITVPKESWWTDEIKTLDGETVFRHPGWKIYKARWVLPNPFSY